MLEFIGLIIIILLYRSWKKSKNKVTNTTPSFFLDKVKQDELLKRKHIEERIENIKSLLKSEKLMIDVSIIDVTGQEEKINNNISIEKDDSILIPYWGSKYIYSYDEINRATYEQQQFYSFFKQCFFDKKFIDLKGINNYAFILLFDILKQYDNDNDKIKLENNLKLLGEIYPKTQPYTKSFFLKKIQDQSLTNKIDLINSSEDFNNNYDSLGLGNQYKYILELSKEDIKLLNKLRYSNTSFINIEYCFIEVLKLYIVVINKLKKYYKSQSLTIRGVFDEIANNRYEHQNLNKVIDSYQEKYMKEFYAADIYTEIFRYCENYIRDTYNYKRKLTLDSNYPHEKIKDYFYEKVLFQVLLVLEDYKGCVAIPNSDTEIELNRQNTTRWKTQFEKIQKEFSGDYLAFKSQVLELAKLNSQNPSLENIYFEASKFIALSDRETSLILYLYYVYTDLQSNKINSKQLPKNILKQLFPKQEEFIVFENIIAELIQNKDLTIAIDKLKDLKQVSRKKIELNRSSIDFVIKEHSSTVELLNEYLQDEEEIQLVTPIKDSTKQSDIVLDSKYLADLNFNNYHTLLLDLFFEKKFLLSIEEVEHFAKNHSVFVSNLIDSINEKCYDILDDILIEEENNNYIINQDYLQQILKK